MINIVVPSLRLNGVGAHNNDESGTSKADQTSSCIKINKSLHPKTALQVILGVLLLDKQVDEDVRIGVNK